jgi:hypothetical protein
MVKNSLVREYEAETQTNTIRYGQLEALFNPWRIGFSKAN